MSLKSRPEGVELDQELYQFQTRWQLKAAVEP